MPPRKASRANLIARERRAKHKSAVAATRPRSASVAPEHLRNLDDVERNTTLRRKSFARAAKGTEGNKNATSAAPPPNFELSTRHKTPATLAKDTQVNENATSIKNPVNFELSTRHKIPVKVAQSTEGNKNAASTEAPRNVELSTRHKSFAKRARSVEDLRLAKKLWETRTHETTGAAALMETQGRDTIATSSRHTPGTRRGQSSAHFVGFSIVGVLVAACLVTVLLYLVVTQSNLFATEEKYCRSASCQRYSDALTASMDLSVDPCENFYLYVCGRRDPVRSVRTITFDEYTNALLTAPSRHAADSSGQNTGDKVKAFLKSCRDVVNVKDTDNLPWIKMMMQEAKLSWPYASATNDDAVHSLVYVSVCCAWPNLIDLKATRKSSELTVAMEPPGDRFKHEYHDRDQIDDVYLAYYSAIVRYFDTGSAGVGLEEMMALEAPFLGLKNRLQENSLTRYQWRDSTVWRRWINTLTEAFSARSGATITVATTHHAYLDSLMQLVFANETRLVLVLGWHVVQFVSPFANEDLAVNHYGTSIVEGIARHLRYCLTLTNTILGVGTIADFVAENFTDRVRDDVANVARSVRQVMFENTTSLTARFDWENLSPIFQLFDKALSPDVHRVFQNVPDMTANIAENVAKTQVALRSLDVSLIRGVSATAYARDELYTYDGVDITLLPNAIMFPMYMEDAPRPILYGTLGTELAAASAHPYFDRVDNSSIQDLLHCLTQSTSASIASKVTRPALTSLASISAALRALTDSASDELVELRVAPQLTATQLFFVSFCYSQCATRQLSDHGRCNFPLRNTTLFAEAFSCPEGSFMRPLRKLQCSIRHF